MKRKLTKSDIARARSLCSTMRRKRDAVVRHLQGHTPPSEIMELLKERNRELFEAECRLQQMSED